MNRRSQLRRFPLRYVITATALLTLLVGAAGRFAPQARAAMPLAPGGCHLNAAQGAIQHVIYLQFDNTHFLRDDPNVPSDLEQMPHLLNFIEGNGVLLTNHHTPLIAHTATDIVTSETGVYPDRHGVPISNSYRFYNPDGSSDQAGSFAYWTDPIVDYTVMTPTDKSYTMLDLARQNAPAPWVPYTRAGCNFGTVAAANTELENTTPDVAVVYGRHSPQAAEALHNPNLATADFEGIAVHCAQGNALCAGANGGQPDVLRDEPGGYVGYQALYGHKYVAPQISPTGPITDLNGNPITNTSAMTYGFPGYDSMTPTISLAYVAAMQEHGIPVTYAYISDAHDNHTTGTPFGPGEAGYVAQLKAYDAAFATFFARLANDDITPHNTLFVITADEGDHFVGGPPSPPGCNGVTTPCTYNRIGEIDGNLTGLLATEQRITTPFQVHADAAPVFYLDGDPARDAPVTRAFERAVSKLTALNLYTGKTDRLTHYLADPVEMKLLHMITADPARTPTFTMFANPNYYLDTGAPTCSSGSPCVTLDAYDAWNHGDVAPEINTTWLGLVGPGVPAQGVNHGVWSDHTDIRPTMLALLGLQDDYSHDGRVLFEVLDAAALPASLREHRATLTELAQTYKQIDASVGALSLASLRISTAALASDAPDDATYARLEGQLVAITEQRDALAGQMSDMLEDAAFHGQPIDVGKAQQLIAQADALLASVIILSENV